MPWEAAPAKPQPQKVLAYTGTVKAVRGLGGEELWAAELEHLSSLLIVK